MFATNEYLEIICVQMKEGKLDGKLVILTPDFSNCILGTKHVINYCDRCCDDYEINANDYQIVIVSWFKGNQLGCYDNFCCYFGTDCVRPDWVY